MKCPFLKEGSGLPECNTMLTKTESYCLSEFHYEEFCIHAAYRVCPFFIRNLGLALTADLKAA